MTAEESIVRNLTDKFNFLNEKCFISRVRRITAEVPLKEFLQVIEYAKKELLFTMLCTITGLDGGDNLQAIYHLADDRGIVLNLKIDVSKTNPEISSVTHIYQGASLYERELIDMFGFVVKGTPPGYRYPLPDSWPEDQHPLRKDWKQDTKAIAGKGVMNNE